MDAQSTVPPGASSNPNENRPEMAAPVSAGEQVVQPAPVSAEQAPSVSGGSSAPQSVAPAVDPMALVMATAADPATTAPTTEATTLLPNLAADVDVIEPEWVDKAQEAIAKHVGDPYGEEEAVEELQEAYLQQRYGLNVHEPGEDTTNTDSA